MCTWSVNLLLANLLTSLCDSKLTLVIETDSCQFQEIDRVFEMFQEMREKRHQGTWERATNGCVLLSLYHYAFMLEGCGCKWGKPEQPPVLVSVSGVSLSNPPY